MRTQTKIALILFFSNLALIVIFGSAIYYSLNKYSYNDFYKRLQTRATIAGRYYLDADRLSAEHLLNIKEQHLEKLPQEREFLFEVSDRKTRDSIVSHWKIPESFMTEIIKQNRAQLKIGETFYTGLKYHAGGRSFVVIVSADNYYSTHHLLFLRNILFVACAAIIFISIGLSVYFSRHIFAPIKAIAQKVKEISTDNMHLRLEENPNNNEISELILTFNDLLTRMETAFETQKNFISNASHEYGTPLTAIIGEADVALIKDRSVEEYKEILEKILRQAERLDQITKSLLFLAQTGYKGKNIETRVVRIDEVIWEAKKVMDQLNPNNNIIIDLDLLPDDPKKLKVRGSKQLLHLAISNILNNGCKYSQNKPVVTSIASAGDSVLIVIKDEGIGIPEHELQFIYDPFFRASNTSRFDGYGIGLPLARNIIRLHQGSLTVNSVVNTGTMVSIKLPLARL